MSDVENKDVQPEQVKPTEGDNVQKSFDCLIIKADSEEQLVTGVVLVPETFDSDNQIYSAETIAKTAHEYLAGYNRRTITAVQHVDTTKQLEVVESWIAPMNLTLDGVKVKKGTWLMTMHVVDSGTWAQVKKGELTGFSIKGKAVVTNLEGDAS